MFGATTLEGEIMSIRRRRGFEALGSVRRPMVRSRRERARLPVTTAVLVVLVATASSCSGSPGSGSDGGNGSLPTAPPSITEPNDQKAPTGWPFRNRSADPVPDEVPVGDPDDVPNPVVGGGVSVDVTTVEARLKNELQATILVRYSVTNQSLTLRIQPPPVEVWCRFPVSTASHSSGYSLPEVSGTPEDLDGIEPLATEEYAAFLEVNLPLNDCHPIVAMNLADAPSNADSASTLRRAPQSDGSAGDLWLELPLNVERLVHDAPPLAADIRLIGEVCDRVVDQLSVLYNEQLGMVRDNTFPCEFYSTVLDGKRLYLSLDAGFGPQTPDPDGCCATADDLAPGAVQGVGDGYAFVNWNTGNYLLKVTAVSPVEGDVAASSSLVSQVRTIFRLVTLPEPPPAADHTTEPPATTTEPTTTTEPPTPPQLPAFLSCFPECAGGDFEGRDMTGLVLSGGNFDGANFRNAILDRADLSGASFVGTFFIGTRMSGAHLDRGVFTNTILTGSTVDGSYFDDARFDHATLTLVDAKHAYFPRAVFNETQLWGAQFLRADFTGADLSTAVNFGMGGGADETVAGECTHGEPIEGPCIVGYPNPHVNLDLTFRTILIGALMPDGTVHP